MQIKKTSVYSTLEIVFGALSIVISVAIFIILQLGIFDLNTSGSFSEGIGKAFGILFYALFMIVQCVFSIVMIIEGITVKAAVKKYKNINPLIIVIGIIKLAVVAFSGLMAGIEVGVQLWTFGAICTLYAVVILFTAVFGFVCTKEIKASLTFPSRSKNINGRT